MKFCLSSYTAYAKSYWLFILFLIIGLGSCTNEEVPVRVHGQVINAITGNPMPRATIRIENVICTGFTPAVCNHIRLSEESDADGRFSFQYFQDCQTEIYAEERVEGAHRNGVFTYTEVAGRDKDISCNGYPKIQGDDGFFFEIAFQPIFFVDIFAVNDPSKELESFSFNGEKMDIIESSHFQIRHRIELEAFQGIFTFKSTYKDGSEVEEIINFNYELSDELEYEIAY